MTFCRGRLDLVELLLAEQDVLILFIFVTLHDFGALHNVCHSRLKQPLFCPVCNRNVERSEIVKGHEYEKDQYVLFSEEELDKIEPPSAKVMESWSS